MELRQVERDGLDTALESRGARQRDVFDDVIIEPPPSSRGTLDLWNRAGGNRCSGVLQGQGSGFSSRLQLPRPVGGRVAHEEWR